MIRSKVDVVLIFGPEIALKAAVAASQSVPIVMIAVNFDPVALGYVSNIARPDKNVTGLVYRAPELAAKQLELLAEAFQNDKPVAVLWETASARQFDAAQRAARSNGSRPCHCRRCDAPNIDVRLADRRRRD
jgi:putative ABC transport system substrate-binding protein